MKLTKYLTNLILSASLLSSCSPQIDKEIPQSRNCYVKSSSDNANKDTEAYKNGNNTIRTSSLYNKKEEHEHRNLEWYLDTSHIQAVDSGEIEKLKNITIAVLDTGLAYENYTDSTTGKVYMKSPDLKNIQVVSGYDFINDDSHPNDDEGHGTSITSLIAADGGAVGVAPGVKIMPIKVLDDKQRGTINILIKGIDYAVKHGADIINMSTSFPLYFVSDTLLQKSIKKAHYKGVILVGAAGNDGENEITYPARYQDVISVGSYFLKEDRRLGIAPYSNLNDKLSIMAPGGRLDLDTNKDGQPDGILAMTIKAGDPTGFGYWFQVGTSPSTAIVSGVVARLLANGCPTEEVYKILRSTPSSLDGIPVLDLAASLEKLKDYKLAQK